MPRGGALTLSDVLFPTLTIVCEPCGSRGRYNVARLIEEPGDAKLTRADSNPDELPESAVRERL
jgi:hypothetical protein